MCRPRPKQGAAAVHVRAVGKPLKAASGAKPRPTRALRARAGPGLHFSLFRTRICIEAEGVGGKLKTEDPGRCPFKAESVLSTLPLTITSPLSHVWVSVSPLAGGRAWGESTEQMTATNLAP